MTNGPSRGLKGPDSAKSSARIRPPRRGRRSQGSVAPAQERLEKIRQARLELEAEASAAAARERAEQAASQEAADAAAAAEPEEQQQELRNKADKARQKADASKELALEKAEQAGEKPPDLQPLPADAIPRRRLAHKADGSPTAKFGYRSPQQVLAATGRRAAALAKVKVARADWAPSMGPGPMRAAGHAGSAGE